MTWRITWGERSWTEADLTGRHLVLISLGVGTDGWDIAPTQGPIRLLANLAAFLAIADGRELTDVLAGLNTVPAAEILAALTIE